LWAEGLRLGALLLLVSLTSDAASATWLQTNHVVFTWIFSDAAGLGVTLASAAAVAAVARGWFRAALVLVGVAVAAGWSGLRYPPELWAYLTTAGILAVLAGRPPANPHRRAWPWLLATPLTLVVGLYGVHFPTDRFHPLSGVILDLRTLLPVAVLLVAVLLWLPVDPRPAIAAAVYLGPLLPGYLVTTVQYPSMGMAWWEVGPPWSSPLSPGRCWSRAPPEPTTCPASDLASLAAGGNHPGALWRAYVMPTHARARRRAREPHRPRLGSSRPRPSAPSSARREFRSLRSGR
jgi:hypothetical protein